MKQFPSLHHLATAPLADVLVAWQGLGYNRRAKYLHQIAQTVEQRFDGRIPDTHESLVGLSGIGTDTAGAILAYAFEQPMVYIETNIRTVFIHHFFPGAASVADSEVLPLVAAAVDREQPRQWYWAVMDYGAWLKSQSNNIRRSSHYKKQSSFQGSSRQIRGRVLRELSRSSMTIPELSGIIADDRFEHVITALSNEGLIEIRRDRISLTGR
jgi:A/G-specific adenine glycosylase